MVFVEEEKYKNKFGIYCIINVLSGDAYVGQTHERFVRRFWHHRWKLRDNSHDNQHLQNAWNLYGEDNFLFIPIKIIDKPDLLDELEIKYINIYRELQHCYNIIDGVVEIVVDEVFRCQKNINGKFLNITVKIC